MENITNKPNQNNSVKKLIEIPIDLYERFLKSLLRRGCKSDSEGIRAALRQTIEAETQSQVKND